MEKREPLVLVGLVKPNGRLATVWISPCAVHIARTQGWWVFDDFETLITEKQPEDMDLEDGA